MDEVLLQSFRTSLSKDGTFATRDGLTRLSFQPIYGHVNLEMLALFGIKFAGSMDTQSEGVSFNTLSKMATKKEEIALWELTSVLFDPILVPNHESPAYLVETERMSRLDEWFSRLLADHSGLFDMFPILSKLLIENDLAAACSAAHNLDFPRFASVISLGHFAADFRKACFEAQLKAWQPHAHRIPREHLLVLQLLSGRFDELDKLFPAEHAWIFKLAIRFRFGIANRPVDRLFDAISQVGKSGNIYIGLLRFYLQSNFVVDRVINLSDILAIKFLSAFSYGELCRISWVLSKMLLGESSHVLDRALAAFLEASGHPELALCLCRQDPHQRLEIICRNIDKLDGLDLPGCEQDLLTARAFCLAASGAPPIEQYLAFVSIRDWDRACELLALEIGPACLFQNDSHTLYTCLSKLPVELLETRSVTMSMRQVVAVLYGFLSIQMNQLEASPDELRTALISSVDSLRSISGPLMQKYPTIKAMLSLISESLLRLRVVPLQEMPLQSLPIPSSFKSELLYTRCFKQKFDAVKGQGTPGMAKKSKARVVAAKLYSTAGSGFMYTFRRPRTAPKFELIKFDPLVNQHVLFTESKPAAAESTKK